MPSRDRFELRAYDAVAQCLIRRLTVPRIYFDAEWPGLADKTVDVLVIDRDGVGDVHIVEVKRHASDAFRKAPELLRASAPFRWLAFEGKAEIAHNPEALKDEEQLYSPTTSGRIGVIEIVENSAGDLGATVKLAAERFPDRTYDIARAFSDSHKAHIQFGD